MKKLTSGCVNDQLTLIFSSLGKTETIGIITRTQNQESLSHMQPISFFYQPQDSVIFIQKYNKTHHNTNILIYDFFNILFNFSFLFFAETIDICCYLKLIIFKILSFLGHI